MIREEAGGVRKRERGGVMGVGSRFEGEEGQGGGGEGRGRGGGFKE